MRQLKHLIFLTLMCLCCTLQALAGYSGSSTEPSQITAENYTDYGFTADNYSAFVGYYGIRNAEELYGFAAKVNSGSTSINGVLTADIVVNDSVLNADGSLKGDGSNFTAWTPIGTSSSKYAGTFDGNGHTVSGLYFNNTDAWYVGLFGYVTGGTIRNVGVVDSYIRANQYVGAVVGELYNGTSTINNCFNEASIYTTHNSYAFAGGIAGHAYGSSSTITNCYNKGKITGSGEYTGGICGILESSASLSNCFNVGSVTSSTTSYLASIAPRWSNAGVVTNSYYLAGTCAVAGNGTSATAEEFASGRVTYLLNGSKSDSTVVWRQNLSGTVDALPIYDTTHAIVYLAAPCPVYSNTTEKEHGTCNVLGQCPDCGKYLTAPLYVETAAIADSLGLDEKYVGYYAIENIGNLYWFAERVNSGSTSIKGVLTADIVVNDSVLTEEGALKGTPAITWTPIGTSSYAYAGTFDGNGHTISGLYFSNTTNSNYPAGGKYVGLFGYVSNPTIKNVGLVDSYLKGYQYVGGIVGYVSSSAKITNCYNAASVYATYQSVGGICGYLAYGTITNSYNTGKVYLNVGNVTSDPNYAGGITGRMANTAKMANCYNTGDVESYGYYAGGITGFMGNNNSIVSNFNTGNVTARNYASGITAHLDGTAINNFALSGTATSCDGGQFATADEFASGFVTFNLNNSKSDSSVVWYQTIGTDSLPVWDNTHSIVYAAELCHSAFANSAVGGKSHTFDEFGQCTVCGAYMPATLVADAAAADSLELDKKYVGYYAIAKPGQLYWFAEQVNSGSPSINGVLLNNIVVNDSVLRADGSLIGAESTLRAWTPIGTYNYDYDYTYNGTFDGNGHTISGLYFNNTTGTNYPVGGVNVGLFGNTGNPIIKNVGLVDSYIKGNQLVGGIVGKAYAPQIINCYSAATLCAFHNHPGDDYMGGICGYMRAPGSLIDSCYNTGNIYGYYSRVGGICGYQVDGKISNSYNTGKIYSETGNNTGNNGYIGGISGYMEYAASIVNCYNIGDVEAKGKFVGGISGYMANSNNKVTNCYNLGSVSANQYAGGINGYQAYGTVTSNFNAGAVTANSYAKGISGYWNSGSITNCYVLSGSAPELNNGTSFSTADEFASGKIAYALNGKTSSGTLTWFQTIGTDSLPVMDTAHGVVYISDPCHSLYGNTVLDNPHQYDDFGQCTACHEYLPVTLIADAAMADSLGFSDDYVGFYAIQRASDLYWFAAKVNSGSTSIKGVLTTDIVVNDSVLTEEGALKGTPAITWTPIGTSSYAYAGTFDGNGHTISGLYFNNTSSSYVGLFGFITGGTIRSVGVVDSYFKGNSYVGGIAGRLYNGTSIITNCFNEATVSANNGSSFAGGVCGHAFGSTSTITNCYNKGKISTIGQYTGGICGILESSASLSNCFNVGSVTSSTTSYLASIAPRWSSAGTITNSYYLEGTSSIAGVGTAATADEFASGKVTFALNNSKSDSSIVWFQTIDTDSLPVFDKTHSTVYASEPCHTAFANSEGGIKPHTFDESGICTLCGAKMPATFVADAAIADSLGLDEKYVGYYAIAKPVQLYWFADLVNGGTTDAKGVLQNSIVVNDSVLTEDGSLKGTPAQTWTPIGTSSIAYTGTFDGNSHTISGLYFNNTSTSYVGLFGNIGAGTVKKVVIADSYIKGYSYVGGICGYISGAAQISNCHNSATVYASYNGDACAGGICGYMGNSSATISGCTNDGYISVYRRCVGGICGYQSSGTITNCHNNGRIYANAGNSTGNNSYAGGISGYMENYSYANISHCYNTGAVEGKGYYVGGITGRISGKITYCYNVGAVTASSNAGAIYGYNNSANCSNNYALSGSAMNNWGGTFATAEEFANGRVAYLLNASKSDSTVVWRQTIGTDSLPVYDSTHSIVYLAAPCAVYSNTTEKEHGTCNVLGQCPDCGKYLTAPLYVETAAIADSLGLDEKYVGYYAISNAAHLYGFADMVNSGSTSIKGVLLNNITINDSVLRADGSLIGGADSALFAWTPIGTSSYNYVGTFDGNGHTVSGLYFNNTTNSSYPVGGNHVGLFGYVSSTTIKNVGLVDSYIKGSYYMGGIAGYVVGSTHITNCYNEATIYANYSSESDAGGICGYMNNSSAVIENCHNAGYVDGRGYIVGGICGYQNNGKIINCYNTAKIYAYSQNNTSYYSEVGGITGFINNSASIVNCYNTGTIETPAQYAGGIVGYMNSSSTKVTNCYNTGNILSCNSTSRGIVGYMLYTGTYTNNFALSGTAASCDGGQFATADEFASGKVAYVMNGSKSDSTVVWRQTIGTDSLPVFDNTHSIVYAAEPCHSAFGNSALEANPHTYDTFGQCTVCGEYMEATLVADAAAADSLGLDEKYVGYYAIAKPGQLYWFAEQVNGGSTSIKGVLLNNITINDSVLRADGLLIGADSTLRTWTPIGTSSYAYYGTFDGNGHTISGLYTNVTTNYVGLFGYINNPTIKNVGLVDSYFKGYQYVAGIAGYVNGSAQITNCYNAATVYSNYNGDDYVGGICGYMNSSSALIDSCYNIGYVSGYYTVVGGICGYQSYGKITNSYNAGKVYANGVNSTTNSATAGGIVGYMTNTASIANCYNTGDVEAYGYYAGGIVGYTYSSSNQVTNCYNLGGVNANQYAGGIIGYQRYGTVTNSFNAGSISASNYFGGIYGLKNYSSAVASNNFVLADSTINANGGTFATADEFASGKIAYQLNNSVGGAATWYQNLSGTIDSLPVLDKNHSVVYMGCDSVFVNDLADAPHTFVNGVCSVCGEKEYPMLVDGWYEIENQYQLIWFAEQVNSGRTSINAKLTADIVLNDSVLNAEGSLIGGADTLLTVWKPIGTSSYYYAGTFDGQGHTISGLYFNNTTNSNYPNGGNYIGLFGYISNSTIKNVGVIDSYFYGYNNVGGICGYMAGSLSEISNCYNTGYVSCYYRYVGGIVGCQSYGRINNCHNAGKVYSYASANSNNDSYTAGIAGYAGNNSVIENCYNTGAVESYGRCAGGIIGYAYGSASVNVCYNTGDIKAGGYYAAGIIGYMGSGSTKITSCFSTGTITALSNGYGITGNWAGTCTNNYVLSGTTSNANGGTFVAAAEIASGKLAYIMNNKITDSTVVWHQTIGTDSTPVLDKTHGLVYCAAPCPIYSNTDLGEVEHNYVDGFCTGCGKDQNEPMLVDGWYEITNAGELYWFANLVNSGTNRAAKAVLMVDIVVNDSVLSADGTLNGPDSIYTSWTPIGTTSYYYQGTFDGQNHTISGLYFNNTSSNNYPSGGQFIGLFGYTYNAKISNVGVTDTYFNGYRYIGGIVGWVYYNTTITNCYSEATLSATNTSDNYLGGIVGGIDSYTNNKVTSCYSIGKITGKGYYVGGICGYKGASAVFTNNFYADSCAFDGNNFEQFGFGASSRGISTPDTKGITTAATAADFASGRVTFGLNGGKSDNTVVWRQTIGEDELPVMDTSHSVVYASAPCASLFSNTDGLVCEHADCDLFGLCPVCGEYTNVPVYVETAGIADSLGLTDSFVGYYAIENASQLYWFANLVNSGTNRAAKAVLTADITVNDSVLSADGSLNGDGSNFAVWAPIGSQAQQYTGTFDGNSHTISGLYFNDENAYYVGLIGYSNSAQIKNLGIADSYFYGYQCVGAISGYSGYQTNCHNAGTVKCRNCYAGGICGQYGTQTNCYNTGVVSGYQAGGICGYDGTQTNCYNAGTVSGSNYIGGISGYSGTQTKCYNIGTVSATQSNAGGISGYSGTQNYCYNAGEVSATYDYVGGISGYQGTQTGCFNIGEVSGRNYVGGISGLVNSVTRSYCLEGTTASAGGGQFATADEFAGGKVAYGLNGKTSTGTLNWYQTLGDDELPVWDNTHSVVYASTPCAGQFSNTEGVEKEHAECNVLGQCPDCGEYLVSPLYVATADIADSLGLSVDYVGYYAIENAAHLYGFAKLVNSGSTNAKAVLLADITVNDSVLNGAELNGDGSNFAAWTPIGTQQKSYYGTFDGQGHTISGIYFNDETALYVGLFGYVNNPTIKNTSLVDSYIAGRQCVGGFCGYIGSSAQITNCHNAATVYASHNGESIVGGICGEIGSTAAIDNCSNAGYISCYYRIVGGICGSQYYGTISNCYNTGKVYAYSVNSTGNGAYAGGITGYMYYSSATIDNCYNTGNIESKGQSVGGIVGYMGNGTVTNNFSTGTISAYSNARGVIGYKNRGTNDNNFVLKGSATSILPGDTLASAEQFAGGMVTYKLNGNSSVNPKWFQTIGEDAIPVRDTTHAIVYKSVPCPYTNDTTGVKEHNYVDDVCTNCGHIILPELTDGWYEIASVGQLLWFADTVNSNNISIKARLVADIVLNDSVLNADGTLRGTPARIWEPIGNSSYKFNGEFDGQGHTISGVYINGSNSYVGLFGYIDAGKVKNVSLVDSYIAGYNYVGGICGYISGAAQISNCHNSATVYASYDGDAGAGGICGYMGYSTATISGCTNDGYISVYRRSVGGICGYQYRGLITYCHNSGRIYSDAGNNTDNNSYAGGICGYMSDYSYAIISYCYNTGAVEGKGTYTGGITGRIYGTITNCFNVGMVTASSYAGAIYGYNWSANYSNNYALSGSAMYNWGGTFYPATDFASGKIAYLLNGSVSGGTVWRQTLGTDAYPTLDTASLVVYTSAPCPFSNNSDGILEHEFDEESGFCTHCGAGSAPALVDGWYEISKPAHLYWLADTVNNHGYTSAKARLVADIVVNDSVLDADGNPTGTLFRSWTPIGTNSYSYQGTFDGQNHTISGLYFNNTTNSNYPSGGNYIALFGRTYNAKISNVGVTDTYFNAYYCAGGIVGWVGSATTITNCYSNATIFTTRSDYGYAGGIAGGIDSYSSIRITGCYSIGKVGSYGYYVGGISGYYGNSSKIINCYYADSCAVDGNNFTQFGVGASTKGISTMDAPGATTAATAADFASGRVTFGLNGGKSDSTVVWRQTIGTDLMPVWDTASALVYTSAPCPSQFSNTPGVVKQHAECDAVGHCPDCGQAMGYAVLIETAAQADSLGLSSSFVGYYAISNAAQLYWFADTVNAGFTSAKGVLVADIVVNDSVLTEDGSLNGTPEFAWTPMGSSSSYYTGTFDGNNHTISGLYIDNAGAQYVGLFGYISGGYVKNLGIVDSYIYGYQYVGGISGYHGTFTNCYNAGTVKGKSQYVGGICGSNGTQNYCYNEGKVVGGNNYTGGISGIGGTQNYCYNTGEVSGGYYVGGITGENGTQNYCYNTGAVSGNYYIGGIVGEYGNQNYSYNIGTVTGTNDIGGISGYQGSQTRCFNMGTITATSGSNVGSLSGYQGTQTYCYYLAGSSANAGGGIAATAADFASGKVAFGLNGNTSTGTLYWYQNIDSIADPQPVFDNTHGKVYASSPCHSAFGNSAVDDVQHVFDAFGQCTLCGDYMEATYIANATMADTLGLSSDYVGYYAIGNAAQLYWFAEKVNNGSNSAKAVLTADIVFNDSVLNVDGSLNGTPAHVWTPIGTSGRSYSGTFDGQGHTISGLYYENTNTSYVGLFGYINNPTIKNVGLVDSYIKGNQYVGGIIGYSGGAAKISNCYNAATVYANYNGDSYAGGICGGVLDNDNVSIDNCYNTGYVYAYNRYAGGICGYQYRGIITNCYNTGKVYANDQYAGGITGRMSNSASISNCYNTGAVEAYSYYSGGIVGYIYSGTNKVTNCYNTGSVKASGNVGGIYGYRNNSSAVVTNNYVLTGSATYENGGTFAASTEFASGQIAYLLNGSATVGYDWYQTLGTDTYPVLDNSHALVWRNCDSTLTNDSAAITHHFVDGVCSVCGAIDEVPALVDGWYLIDNNYKLYWFANRVNSGNGAINGKLTADIVVNENVLTEDGGLNGTPAQTWTPIGTSVAAFVGKFDGQGHTISGLYFNNTNSNNYPSGGSYVGLFGYISTGASIANVGLVDSYIKGYYYVGGICGRSYYGSITNCYNSADVYSTISGNNSYIGGICGYLNYGTVTNCHNTGNVNGYGYYVGGISGYSYYGEITYCYNTGNVSSSYYNVGGISGYKYYGNLSYCYNTGNVSSNSYNVGGICGYNQYGTFSSNYNTGAVRGTYYVGAIVGYYNGTVSYCCYLPGSAFDGSNCEQRGIGYSSQGYANTDYSGRTTAVTTEEFASGKAAYLLNGSNFDATTWRQTLFADAMPVWDTTSNVVTGYAVAANDSLTTVIGNLVIATNYTVASGTTLYVPAGASLTTADSAIITNNGTLKVDGTLAGNNLAGSGSFVYRTLTGDDVALVDTVVTYNGEAFTLDNGVSAEIATHTICGKEFSFDDSEATVSYSANRNVGTASVVWKNFNNTTVTKQFEIVQRQLTVTIDSTFNKGYDGTKVATGVISSNKIDGDDVTVSYSAAFADAAVGTGKKVTYNFTVSGTDARNYSLVSTVDSAVADIVPATGVVVTITGKKRTVIYNGEEHFAAGYTVSSNNASYTTASVAFSGNDTVRATYAGTYEMQLADSLFSNTDPNYAEVEFVIVNGSLTIAKASVAPNKPASAMETSFANTQLVELPADWQWIKYRNLTVGTNKDTAIYVGADAGNYLTERAIISINRLACLHNGGDSVLYVLEPTCTHAGYSGNHCCKLCGEIYEHGDSIPALGHTPDSIAIENYVAPTYTTAGSYDSVVYCSVCHVELSRTTIEVPMLIAAAQKIELKSMPKVEYVAGEKLDVSGAVVVVTFSNGTTKEVALSAAMVSGFDAKKVGEQKLTVTYTVDGVTLTTTYTVKVEKNTAVDDEAVAEVSIYAINRTIVVETAEPSDEFIHVFDANGRLVAKELATSNRTEIAMTRQGLYIVRIGDKAERVVVY